MISLIIKSTYLALALSLLIQASAYTFIGCTDTFSFRPQPNDPKGHYAGGTSSGCATYCSSLGTPYFYNQYNTGTCYCSSVSPKANQFTYGSSDVGGCEGDNYEIYALKDPINGTNFQGCYTAIATSQHPGDHISTLEGCFSSCPTSRTIFFSPNSETNTFDCKCDPRVTIDSSGGGTTTCGQFTWFAYVKKGSTKRRLSKQLAFDEENLECDQVEE